MAGTVGRDSRQGQLTGAVGKGQVAGGEGFTMRAPGEERAGKGAAILCGDATMRRIRLVFAGAPRSCGGGVGSSVGRPRRS